MKRNGCCCVTRYKSCVAVLFILSTLTFASASFAQTAKDFAGQWVFKLGSRNFMVLTLMSATGEAGPLTGSLLRPIGFSTTDGASYRNISNTKRTELITRTEIREGRLVFNTENPDKSNHRTYSFSLKDADQGRLKRIAAEGSTGFFWDPWEMRRSLETVTIATDWDPDRIYSLDDSWPSNAEMKRIFDEDQKVREALDDKTDWTAVMKSDAERRDATRKLLAENKLHTGEDFEYAAFVFQHGDSPNDYLLAHTLAMVAVAKSRSGALWIASATLDRFLQNINRPQIFGTQFGRKADQPVTQEPYDRTLISDSLRHKLGVPSQAAQEEQRKQFEAEIKPAAKP